MCKGKVLKLKKMWCPECLPIHKIIKNKQKRNKISVIN